MAKYAKCPRCELNYVDTEIAEFCDVCLKEMKGIEDDTPILGDDEDELMELCPKCGENMMRSGEDMCDECKRKMQNEEDADVDIDIDNDEGWRNYLDDDTEDDDMGLDKELAEELEHEFGEEEEEEEDEMYHGEEDEFEYVSADDYNPDEDDEDEENEEDDF